MLVLARASSSFYRDVIFIHWQVVLLWVVDRLFLLWVLIFSEQAVRWLILLAGVVQLTLFGEAIQVIWVVWLVLVIDFAVDWIFWRCFWICWGWMAHLGYWGVVPLWVSVHDSWSFFVRGDLKFNVFFLIWLFLAFRLIFQKNNVLILNNDDICHLNHR